MSKQRDRGSKVKHAIEERMAGVIDDISEFQAFKKELLPKLRAAIKEGKKPEEIMSMAKSLAAARLATIAAWEPDNKTALAAVKDLLDRTEGKARETKDIRHSLEHAKPEELDAILLSKLGEAEGDE